MISNKQNIFVYKSLCPHLNESLVGKGESILDEKGHFIRCAKHQALFTLDQGLCIKGPCNTKQLAKQDFILSNGNLFIKDEYSD